MAAVLYGKPSSGQKELRSSIIRRERVGLETLSEIYTVRREDVPSIIPAYDSAHPTYANLALEEVDVSPEEGDLASMTLKYVGLTGSSNRPVFRTLYADQAITYYNPYIYEIQFVEALSNVFSVLESNKVLLSASFRGITLPGAFVGPFTRDLASEENDTADYYKSIGWKTPELGNSSYTGPTIEETSERTVLYYEGVRRQSITYEKRGLCALFTSVYAEQYRIVVPQDA